LFAEFANSIDRPLTARLAYSDPGWEFYPVKLLAYYFF
jgi:hypothetical protein